MEIRKKISSENLLNSRAPGNRTPLSRFKFHTLRNTFRKKNNNGRPMGVKNYFFIRYIASKKSGTPIIKVAASGDTPKILATRSLIALIIHYS